MTIAARHTIGRGPGRRTASRGLSLIELLITIAISLVILTAVSSVYLGSRGAYRTNEGAARVQEAGRFALDSISRDLRSTGNLGCASSGSATNGPLVPVTNKSGGALSVDYSTPGFGSVSGFSSPLWDQTVLRMPFVPTHTYAGNTDVLVVRMAYSVTYPVSDLTSAASSIVTDGAVCGSLNTSGANPLNQMMISTCSRSILVIVPTKGGTTCTTPGTAQTTSVTLTYTNPSGTPLNSGGSGPHFSMEGYPTTQQFDEVVYFIGANRANVGGTSLYRHSSVTGNEDEVVSDVEDMALNFGLATTPGSSDATTSKPLYGINAMAVGDWNSVVSVQVVLQAVGSSGAASAGALNAAQTPPALLPGRPAPAAWNDTRLRDRFSTTVSLRDRTT